MERLTIPEAAQRLGVSEVTIRRRIKRSELVSEKEETASGFVYRVLLPILDGGVGTSQQHPVGNSAALEAAIETLRQELERRSEENRRLHELLAREQVHVQQLIAQLQPQTALPEGEVVQPPDQNEPGDQPIVTTQGWWERLRSRLLGG